LSYSVRVLRRAQKELSRLPSRDYERVRDRIRALADEPRRHGCSKLAGREGWRLRVGDFRVIYEIDDSGAKVTILHGGHRRDIYRR
jgi:mRNA interferase RelE/StbE